MYRLRASVNFDRKFKKIAKKDPVLKMKVTKTLKLMRKDINHPSLRLHKLSGVDNWSVSVGMSVRILFTIRKDRIYLADIGTHDEVY